MLAEKYLLRRYKEGKAKGRAEKDSEWREWYERNKDKIGDIKTLDPPPPKPE